MIKQGIINFFKNLKYFFTPLGAIALGLIFGLSVLIPGTLNSLSVFAGDVQTIMSDTSVDINVLKDSAVAAVKALDWTDPVNALKTMLSNGWIMQMLEKYIGSFVENTEGYTQQFANSVNTLSNEMTTYIAIVLSFAVLGFIGGYFLTKCLIRKDIAKRSIWKFLINALVDAIITATIVALFLWFLSIWKPSIIFSTILSVLLYGFIALLEAYVVHAYKKVPFGKIVNVKNIFKLYLTDAIIFVVAAACIFVLTILTNALVGIFVGIVLMEIAFIVISLNAEAYVKMLTEQAQPTANTQTA